MRVIRVVRVHGRALWTALLLLGCSGALWAGGVSERETLASATCGDVRELTLLIEQTPLAGEDDPSDEQMVVFRLVEQISGSAESSRPIWQTNTSFVGLLQPWPFWRASITCDPEDSRALVTVVGNRGVTALWLDVFSVRLDDGDGVLEPLPETGDLPIVPALGAPSIAHFSGRLSLKSGGLGAVETELDGRTLEVSIKQCAPEAAPVRLEVDLETGEVQRRPAEDGGPSESEAGSGVPGDTPPPKEGP